MRYSLIPSLLAAGMLLPALRVLAAGFVPLPATGVAVENGTSTYILCNVSGRFDPDSRHSLSHKPTPEKNNTCAVFPESEISAPLPGFSLTSHASRQAVMNHALTGFEDKKIASVMDIVWRNDASGECIYGTKVIMLSSTDADYNADMPGKQFFRVTDIARSGFVGQEITAAYAVSSPSTEPVYRIGRSFTAVQYHKRSGYQRQPLTESEFSKAFNGIDAAGKAVPEPQQQSASLNDNWVDFTTLAGLPKRPASPMLYVKAPCSSETPLEQAGAIRLRQAVPPFIELSVPGFVPRDATAHATSQP